MNDRYIIEVRDGQKQAFVTEHAGELFLTGRREEAAVFPSKLDAMCALVYIADHHQPKLVPCEEGGADGTRKPRSSLLS